MSTMRFGMTGDLVVKHHPANAVKFLWSGAGKDRLSDLGLATSGNALVLPEEDTVLLMGTTSELAAEIERLGETGIDRFTVPGRSSESVLMTLTARQRTKAGGGIGLNQVTVIALVDGALNFGDGWVSADRIHLPPLRFDELSEILEWAKGKH